MRAHVRLLIESRDHRDLFEAVRRELASPLTNPSQSIHKNRRNVSFSYTFHDLAANRTNIRVSNAVNFFHDPRLRAVIRRNIEKRSDRSSRNQIFQVREMRIFIMSTIFKLLELLSRYDDIVIRVMVYFST